MEFCLSYYVQDLKQTIQVVEEKGAELVSLGKTMQVGIDEGSDAEQYVDKRLSEVESHMEGLVTPTKGKIEATETDVDKVSGLYAGCGGSGRSLVEGLCG